MPRSRRRVDGRGSAVVVALALAVIGADGPVLADAGCFWPPVEAPIVDPFRPPDCPYCAGNRGLEYTVADGTPVRAMAAGTVTFGGDVAGIRYLVVRHADGRLATYGRLATLALGAGAIVGAGSVVGTTTGGLYVGLRDGDVYVDPAPLLGRLVRPPRLVPLDGTPARPAPPPRLVCRSRS